MKLTVDDIRKMIQDELDRQRLNPANLTELLHTCRSNCYKIVNEKKFNDLFLLINLSIAIKHNFLQDLADIVNAEISTNLGQKVH
ncbi:MAG: hypothetical protein J6T70_01755 [Bacteroidales bacterium]|nr:hypothetical protein [Bacteroidales bacterium]